MLWALPLPTAALVTSVSSHSPDAPCFEFCSRTFEGSTNHGSFPTTLDSGTFTVVPPKFAPRHPDVSCVRLSSGTVTVKNPATDTVFTDAVLKDGFIFTLNDRVNRNAPLLPDPVLIGNAHLAFEFNHHTMSARDALAFGFDVPPLILEPSTLRVLGTDLNDLAELARRLKLWR